VSINQSTGRQGDQRAKGLRVALVCARFNDAVVGPLEEGARGALRANGARESDITTVWVPGAWEIPVAARALAVSGRFDAIVALGCVIRGETYHFEVIADQSNAGLMQLAIDTGIVVTTGILTVESNQQAYERVGGSHGHKGAEAALAAVETINAVRAALA
jgi:6,7-dimethyl-8-ribityllumazine synthase